MKSLSRRKVDLAIIGGGAAGLAAAIKAKEAGVDDCILFERNEELGGILPQCIHTGFGTHYFKENLTGPEYIHRFIENVHKLHLEYHVETMVLAISPGKEITAVNSVDGLRTYQARAIVLAMGCRERTRGMLGIAGTRPAGVLTAGTAQRLMDIKGYLPGKKIVILGSGDIGLIMARRFAMEGAEVPAVVEILPYPSGLDRNVVQCLEDFDIPLLLQHTVTMIHGARRIEAVTMAQVDACGKPVEKTRRTVDCDTLILSVGLIPENELSQTAGIALDAATGGPIVNEFMETSVPGVFACGNVVHVHNLVDHVTYAAELAGTNAAKYVQDQLPRLKRQISLKPDVNVKYVVPQTISGERPVTLFVRVKEPIRNAMVYVGNLAIPQRIVKPPETMSINLTPPLLERLEKRDEVGVCVRKKRTRE